MGPTDFTPSLARKLHHAHSSFRARKRDGARKRDANRLYHENDSRPHMAVLIGVRPRMGYKRPGPGEPHRFEPAYTNRIEPRPQQMSSHAVDRMSWLAPVVIR
jgi:hypothetical protein